MFSCLPLSNRIEAPLVHAHHIPAAISLWLRTPVVPAAPAMTDSLEMCLKACRIVREIRMDVRWHFKNHLFDHEIGQESGLSGES